MKKLEKSLLGEYQKLKVPKIKFKDVNLKYQGIKVDNETFQNLQLIKKRFKFDMIEIISFLVKIYDHIYFKKYVKPLIQKGKCAFLLNKKHNFKTIKRFNFNSNLIWISKETHFRLKVMKLYYKISIKDLMRKIVDNYSKFLEEKIINKLPHPEKEF